MEASTQQPVYFWLAIISSALFLIRMLLSLFGADADADTEIVFDDDGGATEGVFQFISIQSILAFLMGTGWMGLACTLQWNIQDPKALVIAAGFGVVLAVFATFLTKITSKLNSKAPMSLKSIEGNNARVHLRIPAKGEGFGQIEVFYNGGTITIDAISDGEPIDSHLQVEVIKLINNKTALVRKV